jgi:hypothetical protein
MTCFQKRRALVRKNNDHLLQATRKLDAEKGKNPMKNFCSSASDVRNKCRNRCVRSEARRGTCHVSGQAGPGQAKLRDLSSFFHWVVRHKLQQCLNVCAMAGHTGTTCNPRLVSLVCSPLLMTFDYGRCHFILSSSESIFIQVLPRS